MKKRINGTISEEAAAFLSSQCEAHDRGVSYALDKAILFAKANGLDLSSGQARETADAFRRRK
jgi:hypothetical protein